MPHAVNPKFLFTNGCSCSVSEAGNCWDSKSDKQCVLGAHWYMKSFKFRRNSLLMLTKFTKTTDTSFVEFAQMFSRRGSEMLYLCLRRTLIVLQVYHTEGRTRVPARSCAVLCGFSVCSLWKVSKLLR